MTALNAIADSAAGKLVAHLDQAGTTFARMAHGRILPAKPRSAWPRFPMLERPVDYLTARNRARPAYPQEITHSDRVLDMVQCIPCQVTRVIVLKRTELRPPELLRASEGDPDPHVWSWTKIAISLGMHKPGSRDRAGPMRVRRMHERGVKLMAFAMFAKNIVDLVKSGDPLRERVGWSLVHAFFDPSWSHAELDRAIDRMGKSVSPR